MNSEIRILEMRVKLGRGDEELDLVQSAALRDLMNAYESQIATLTAERDGLKSELAALKSAPSMAEVDEQFGGLSARLGLLPPSRTREECQSGIEKCYRTTRRFAAERDDVVGLLTKCLCASLSRSDVVTAAEGVFSCLRTSILSQEEARRILKIVEGK